MIQIPHNALATIKTEASNIQAAAIALGYVKDLIDREEVMEKVQDDEENKTLQDYINPVMMDSRIT